MPLAPCTCGASKTIADFDNADKLIQFLMGLNDSYDHQRKVHSEDLSQSSLNVRMTNGKPYFKKREKENSQCNHRNDTGHTKETCFKLHRYPEWFNEYKQKNKEKANIVYETSLEIEGNNSKISNMIQHEVIKYMKGQNPIDYRYMDCGYRSLI
uniref:Uncharacterized protein n=1 Tax=Manihot esculenta TaxID=3983 RepID=A0A2C9VG38_MANES